MVTLTFGGPAGSLTCSLPLTLTFGGAGTHIMLCSTTRRFVVERWPATATIAPTFDFDFWCTIGEGGDCGALSIAEHCSRTLAGRRIICNKCLCGRGHGRQAQSARVSQIEPASEVHCQTKKTNNHAHTHTHAQTSSYFFLLPVFLVCSVFESVHLAGANRFS